MGTLIVLIVLVLFTAFVLWMSLFKVFTHIGIGAHKVWERVFKPLVDDYE